MDTQHTDELVNTLSVDALFTLAATSDDEELAWAAIERLRNIKTEPIFTQAVQFCHSNNPREREAGVDIIAQFGIPEQSNHEQVVQLLLTMLESEENLAVIASILVALGHRRDQRAIVPLLRFEQHPDLDIRYGVVYGLLWHTAPEAISCLIRLSADPEPHVRDWATFGLAEQLEIDTPELRAALIARLADPDGDIAGEAMIGLVRRKDPRVIPALREQLQSGNVGSLQLEAAEALADPILLPALTQLQANWEGEHDWQYSLLEVAILACTPKTAR